jgi:hypothetical protein
VDSVFEIINPGFRAAPYQGAQNVFRKIPFPSGEGWGEAPIKLSMKSGKLIKISLKIITI